jgi:hypothetical protein
MPVQSLGGEASCALNRRSENVIVKAIIVPELELRNVKMMVFLTNMVDVPTMPRLKMLQKPSIVWVCTAPTSY